MVSELPQGDETLRTPAEVMRLTHLGAYFPTRLSFNRRLLRKLRASGALITRPEWAIDDLGFGRAVYQLTLAGESYALACFSQPLDPAQRSDRVIADAWDATFVLSAGVPNEAELERLARAAPRQEAARYEATDLVLARANRSVRAFDHVVHRLAAGGAPDVAMLRQVGYLMRTTAVYGNGKFGIADRHLIKDHPLFGAPFQAELLAVYLIREFTLDLVEHIAARRAPGTSTRLSPQLRRYIGVGNATGLGMAPFLVNHPTLLHRWIQARERALARVRAIRAGEPARIDRFHEVLHRARHHAEEWQVEDPRQAGRLDVLGRELGSLAADGDNLCFPYPWEHLYSRAAALSIETRECLISILLEPYGDLVDELAEEMATDEVATLDPAMAVAELRRIAEHTLDWARDYDFSEPDAQARFWYVSQEKLEPRLGERNHEPGADRELPLDIARQAQAFLGALARAPARQSVAEWLLSHPEQRAIARRTQSAVARPYSEIRDNLLAATCLPIDMLRCKLSFLGATKFDPRSDRWTRITLYQGAPTATELSSHDDDWCFASMPLS